MILLVIKATVQHSYHAKKDDELDLEEGDVVQVFESRKDGWLRGVKRGRSGWFPWRHIKGCTFDYKCTVLLYHIQSFALHCMEGYFLYNVLGTQAKVQQSHRAEEDDELDLEEGDVVQVLAKGEDGRLRGVNRERTGWFPETCVKEQSSHPPKSKGMYCCLSGQRSPHCLEMLMLSTSLQYNFRRKTYVAIIFQSKIIDVTA